MILPIDFLFRLHYIGIGAMAIYDLATGAARIDHPTQLWSFDRHDRIADVIWCPATGDLFAPGMKGEKPWEGVS